MKLRSTNDILSNSINEHSQIITDKKDEDEEIILKSRAIIMATKYRDRKPTAVRKKTINKKKATVRNSVGSEKGSKRKLGSQNHTFRSSKSSGLDNSEIEIVDFIRPKVSSKREKKKEKPVKEIVKKSADCRILNKGMQTDKDFTTGNSRSKQQLTSSNSSEFQFKTPQSNQSSNDRSQLMTLKSPMFTSSPLPEAAKKIKRYSGSSSEKNLFSSQVISSMSSASVVSGSSKSKNSHVKSSAAEIYLRDDDRLSKSAPVLKSQNHTRSGRIVKSFSETRTGKLKLRILQALFS